MFSQTDPSAVRSSAAPLLESLIAEPGIGARRMTLGVGEPIHSHDAAAENLFLIHRGQVRLYQITDNDSARLLEILGRGEWFGVAALAGAERYGSRSVAVVPTVISEVPIDRLREVLQRRPDVLTELNIDLARRLMASRDDASRLTFDDCNQRLITTLIRFSQSAASTPREDGVVLHMTHSQLAQAVGAARETVSLALTHLRRKNLLRTGRNQLFFKPEDLRRANLASEMAESVA